MAKIYFTLTGTRHYYGSDFLKSGMKIQLEKQRMRKQKRSYPLYKQRAITND